MDHICNRCFTLHTGALRTNTSTDILTLLALSKSFNFSNVKWNDTFFFIRYSKFLTYKSINFTAYTDRTLCSRYDTRCSYLTCTKHNLYYPEAHIQEGRQKQNKAVEKIKWSSHTQDIIKHLNQVSRISGALTLP